MVASKTELQSQIINLSTEALETFCSDISAMFDIDMNCDLQNISGQTVSELKKDFKKLVAVNSINAQGTLNGTFHLIFDKDGLFTLAGVIVMLPEQRILENRRKGTAKDAEEMSDAFGEAGNLLVGSWDRIFRENLEGHGHFLQTNTFIGNPWNNSEKNIGLADNTEIVFVPYQMTIGSYPAFNCGVIFPKSFFGETSETDSKTPSPAIEQAKPEPQAAAEQIVADTKKEPAAAVEPPKVQEPEKIQTVEPKIQTPATQAAVEKEIKKEVVKENASATAKTAEPKEPEPIAVQAKPEPPTQAKESKPAVSGEISETIERMTLSQATLPGEYSRKFSSIPAKDIMQTQLLWGTAEDSVQQAMTKMQQADVGYMMVGADGVLEGIVLNQDIASAVSIYLKPMFAKWRRPLDDATLQIKVKWIMTRPVTTIKPDTSITTIMETMRQTGLKSLPVVDQQNKTIGLVTAFDIFKAILEAGCNISTAGKTPQAPPLA